MTRAHTIHDIARRSETAGLWRCTFIRREFQSCFDWPFISWIARPAPAPGL